MYELEKIYNILMSFLGESKQGRYDSSVYQYQFNCPYCADEKGYIDGKYNLECNLQNLVFHCWSCDSSGSLSKLIKRHGGRTLLKEYYETVKSIKESKYYGNGEFAEIRVEKPTLKLPATFERIKIRTCNDKRLVAYLKKRNITQKIINRFNIGYTTWDEEQKSWANRIIIPSYDSAGQLNFFVGRDYLPEKKDREPGSFVRPKYKNCDSDKKEIVFQESQIDWDADITLVEGALDCLYGPNTISLLGKTLSSDSELFKQLTERANANVILCLDNDTSDDETIKICQLLNSTRLNGRIYYVKMNKYKDFGEAYEADGEHGIIGVIKNKKKFENELL